LTVLLADRQRVSDRGQGQDRPRPTSNRHRQGESGHHDVKASSSVIGRPDHVGRDLAEGAQKKIAMLPSKAGNDHQESNAEKKKKPDEGEVREMVKMRFCMQKI
jgi:hypothetical protein